MFAFDRSFSPNCSQRQVYEYSAQPLVNQVIKGFNVTIFAYGQTGSGKTFTMLGTENNPGIIPHMVTELFDQIYEHSERVEFLVRVSYVEIYNEKISDLLDPSKIDLKVREHQDKGVFIEGASRTYIGSPNEVMKLMEQGSLNRTITSTYMNEQSSRGHSIFILFIEQRNVDTETKKISKLMLVDLAGSEKVRKTNAIGKTLKEAKSINRSLACLGMVISSLTENRSHIPYRDSKLTRLLSDSLGGNSKTCIIVTCSPYDYNSEETLSTLKFGIRCKKVKNKPIVNAELSINEYFKCEVRYLSSPFIKSQLIKLI